MRRLLMIVGGLLLVVACEEFPLRAQSTTVREPAVAGQFYPSDTRQLGAALAGFLADAVAPQPAAPVALVVPHAGYVFSGQIAADGWRQAAVGSYEVIVLLGTNHTAGDLRRVALLPGSGLRTPLGIVPIDQALTTALLRESDTVGDAKPHAREHSIEVHLPFVQRLFPKASVVAAVVPAPAMDEGLPVRFGRTLARHLSGRRALVVASSDLSHYPAARDAMPVDRTTLEAMASLDVEQFRRVAAAQMTRGVRELATCACGEAPVIAAMTAARELGAVRGRLISYANSGDLPVGELDRVVGYGAVAFSAGERGVDASALDWPSASPASAPLPDADRKVLLTLARQTITRYLEAGVVPLGRPVSPGMQRVQGAFVTLRKNGVLRGCIGQMTPDAPLRRLIGAMAMAAAFEDPRFDKVRASEMKDIEVEISLLTPFREVPSASAVVVGRDGVLLQKGRASAVFLPQVATEEGWSREEMLDHLCLKAGMSRGCWQSGARLSTFQAEVFKESELVR